MVDDSNLAADQPNNETPEQSTQFEVRLHQLDWAHTETFIVDAETEKEALAQVEEIVGTKDIETDYKLEAIEIEQPEDDEADTATDTEEAAE